LPQSFAARVATCFLPFAAAYFLSYLFRTVNAVVGPVLATELQLDAAALGGLTSAYFAAFALSQIPLGIMLDRYGPRRAQVALLSVAVVGSVVFGIASDATQLTIGRGLIGLGVSGCLMSAFTANVAFWPRERLPLVNGLTLACGGLGATFATLPAQLVLDAAGWRPLFIALAVCTALVVALLWTVAPNPPSTSAGTSWREQMRGVTQVFSSPVFWRLVPMSVATHAAFLAYQGLWAGPWLRDVAGFTPDAIALVLLAVSAMMMIGFALSGAVLGALTRRGLSAEAVIGGATAIFIASQVPFLFGAIPFSEFLWPVFAFVGACISLSFTWLTQRFPPALAGRVSTSLNLLVFLAAFVAQAGVGLIIVWYGVQSPTGGHTAALALLIVLECLGLAWFLWPRPRSVAL
jgi:predicted MFS family arabinose efflux permease